MEYQAKLGKTCCVWLEDGGLMNDNTFLLTHLVHLRIGEVYYDPQWSLYFIKTSIPEYNYAQFFIQYHPTLRKSSLVIAFPANRHKDLPVLTKCLDHHDIKNVRAMAQDGYLEEIHRLQNQVKMIYRKYHLE